MNNVVELDVITRLDSPADRVIARAKEAGLKAVVIIGEFEDGSEFFATSWADGGDNIWALERAKLKLLRMADQTE